LKAVLFFHLNNVKALPDETQTMENAYFQLNTVCCFGSKHAEKKHWNYHQVTFTFTSVHS